MDEQAIFLQAIEYEQTDEQSAFLDRACGADSELRRHLAELLAVHGRAGRFMDEPAVPNLASERADLWEKCGTEIGPYKLMEQIGEGGFGLVFVAEQREPVRRTVALKLIKPGMDSKEIIARFEAERQALALMDHPNIARVLDAGTTESGRPYFVMDLVRGIPITTFCDENQLSPRERLKLFLPICRAVQHAHQKGIIHRDIKPSNLLVTMNDGEPVPKVIDFGVAKALNQQLTQHTVYTRFAQMIGTPLYMSPEQAEMSSVNVDTRSDIYSLGVLLYELLTGTTPFDQKQLSLAGLDEIRRIIREQDPPKPSTRLSQSGERLSRLAAQRKTEPAKLSKMIKGDLDWIVMKALEKDRNRRYETATGFAADIERYLRDEEVVARPPSAGYRLLKFARRNKAAFTTVAIVTVTLFLATIVSTYQWIRASHAAYTSKQNEVTAKQNEQKAQDSEQQLRQAEQEMRERLYASQMNSASEALSRGDIRRMKDLVSQQIPSSPELDQRDFEWDLLWKAGHLSRKWTGSSWMGTGSKWRFHDMAVSPDGNIIAATDRGNATIDVFDGENLNLVCSPLNGGTPFDRLCFSHDGAHLIAADEGGDVIRVFDTKTWAHTMTLDGGGGRAVDCARSKPLMVTSRSKEIRLWDTRSWTVVGSLATHRENCSHRLALSPDGTKLADVVQTDFTIGPDQIDLWDLSGKQLVRSLPGRYLGAHDAEAIEFSPDGNLLVVGAWDGTVRIWNVADLFSTDLFSGDDEPAPVWTLRVSNPVRALDVSSDSKRLAVATALRTNLFVPEAVQVWDIASRERIAVFEDHSKKVTDVAFVGDGNTIGTVSHDRTLKTWDLTESRAYDVIDGVEWRSGFGYGQDGSVIYQDRAEGKIRSWDMTQRESHSILDADNSYSRLGFSSNGRFLAAVTQDEDRLRVWDLADGIERHSATIDLDDLRRRIESEGGVSSPRGNEAGWRDHDKALITRLTVSNDGLLVALVVPLIRESPDPALVVLIDPEDGHPIAQAQHLIWAELKPTFSPSGRQLASHEHWTVYTHLSDIYPDSLRPRLPIRAPGSPFCAAFSPDGGTLAIGNFNNEIRLHRAADGTLMQTLSEHAQWPTSVAFSGNGRHLTSAGLDGRVLIWKKGSDGQYRLVSTLRGLPDMDVMQAAIAPGNESLAVLHALSCDGLNPLYDGKIQVWRVASPGKTRQRLEERLFRLGSDVVRPLEKRDELSLILAHDPDDLRARAMRGELHDALGDGRSAAADWTVALQHVPDNLYFLESRAKAYELAGQWSEAEDDWTTLVRLVQASNGKYLLGRGECYLHMGRLNDAQKDFAMALARTASPDTIERIASLLGLGESLVPVGSGWRYQAGTEPPKDWATLSFNDSQWQTAWAPFGGYQRFFPTRTPVHYQDVWLRHTFELDRDIDAPLALRIRAEGNVEVFVNGVSVAPECVPNYFDDDPWDVWNWNKYVRMYCVVPCSGKVHLHKGKNVLAVRCRNPGNTRTYVDVGLYVANETVDIGSVLDKLADRLPHTAHLHTALAIRFVEQQRWKDAALHFHKSARMSDEPNLPKWMWAALMYRQANDYESYHDLVAEIIDRYKNWDCPETLGRLAKACLLAEPTAENLPGIVAMSDHALQLDANDSSARVAQALEAYWNDNLEDAVRRAGECGNDNCQALCVLALAHARLGKLELARDILAQVVDASPELRFQVSLRKKDAAHEAAFLKILVEEVKRKLTAD